MVPVPLQPIPTSRVLPAGRTQKTVFLNEHGMLAPVITNEARALASVKAVSSQFDSSAKIKILVIACGVPDENGSPIVNALADAFPNGRIVATDVSFPAGGFLRPTNSRFARHDMVTGKVPENRFDVVHCTNFIYYLSTEAFASVVQKLVKAVKPGGMLIIDLDHHVCDVDGIVRNADKNVQVVFACDFMRSPDETVDRRFALMPVQKNQVPQ